MSIKEAAAKVTGKVTGKLTDDQWRERIAASQKKLDAYKASIIRHATRNLSDVQQKDSLGRLGLTPPAPAQQFRFSVPVVLTREYAVLATSEHDAAGKLLALIGENGDAKPVTFPYGVSKVGDTDVSRNTASIVAIRDANKPAATTDPATPDVPLVEQFAALEAEYEELRVKAREEIVRLHTEKPDTYCTDGANDVLADLRLEQLPRKKTFVVDAPVTLTLRNEVMAYTEEEATELAAEYNRLNQRQRGLNYGRVQEITNVGDPTVLKN